MLLQVIGLKKKAWGLSEKCQTSPLQHSFWGWYAFVRRQLLLSRKAMTNLELQSKEVCVLKSKDITLLTNVCIVKAMVFSVEMYQCESWTTKKAEHWRIGAFELWCWRRLLRVAWKARTSNQSILKEMNSEYSLEGLILKLKLQHFGHQVQIMDSLEKTLMLGKIEGRRRRGWQRDEMVGWQHRFSGHELAQTPGYGEGQRGLVFCNPWGCRVGHN